MNIDSLVTVCGNVVAEPRHRRTDAGVDLCSFRIGATPRRFDRAAQAWVDGPTSWFTVTAWRALGANCAASLHKGERVVVQGRLRTRDWTNEEGRSGTSVEIEAVAVGHDLTWGTTSFRRVVRVERVDAPGREDADDLVDEVEGRSDGVGGDGVGGEGAVLDEDVSPVAV